ncbi:MAG: hypothetical protein FJY34_08490 [Betaproteobacteria bacterium]|nr:hypothetical protein [Betaproteobacteria bacterium]
MQDKRSTNRYHPFMVPRWEHFRHEADIGVRGFGPTRESAFEQAALALTAVIADPARVSPRLPVRIACGAPDDALLFCDWLMPARGPMRAAINCALANRQILTHLTRETFREVLPEARLPLLYDVSHNTCKEETHDVGGRRRRLFVHRKGATRAFGPGHPELPSEFHAVGQPVLIGGSIGTGSYILAGLARKVARLEPLVCIKG